MRDTNQTRKAIPLIILLGVVATVWFSLLAPDFLENRREALIGETCRIVRETAKELNDGTIQPTATDHVDAWNVPLRFEERENGWRVISKGPNHESSPSGFDEDDIYSDMPESPVEVIHRAKGKQLLLALLMPVLWLIGLSLFTVKKLALNLMPPATINDSTSS